MNDLTTHTHVATALSPELQSLVNEFEARGVVVELWMKGQDYLELSAIRVPKENRQKGLGTEFMEKLVHEADKAGLTIFLTPSTDFGATSVSRLRTFYGRFGFKRNLGRNKDYRSWAGMVRQPHKVAAEEPKETAPIDRLDDIVKLVQKKVNTYRSKFTKPLGYKEVEKDLVDELGLSEEEAALIAPLINQRTDATLDPNAFRTQLSKLLKTPKVRKSGSSYTVAGPTVDGLTVGALISNKSSIAASLTDYEILDGIRIVPMGSFSSAPTDLFYASNDLLRCKSLAEAIEKSGRIDPLIVVVDKDGPYILEGAHRLGALHILGKQAFPALVVRDLDGLKTGAFHTVEEYLYHVTPASSIAKIMKEGIQPQTGGRTFLNRTYSPRIYLATSLIAAYDLQVNFAAHDGLQYKILEIDASKIPGAGFHPDDKFVHGVWTTTAIPVNAVVKVIDPSTLSYEDDALESLYASSKTAASDEYAHKLLEEWVEGTPNLWTTQGMRNLTKIINTFAQSFFGADVVVDKQSRAVLNGGMSGWGESFFEIHTDEKPFRVWWSIGIKPKQNNIDDTIYHELVHFEQALKRTKASLGRLVKMDPGTYIIDSNGKIESIDGAETEKEDLAYILDNDEVEAYALEAARVLKKKVPADQLKTILGDPQTLLETLEGTGVAKYKAIAQLLKKPRLWQRFMKYLTVRALRTGSLKRAYHIQDLGQLRKYLEMSDEDKGLEMAYQSPYTFREFLERENTEGQYDRILEIDANDGYMDGYLDKLPPQLLKEFYQECWSEVCDDLGAEAPSFLYMEYTGTVKDQWLIHFTEDAASIAEKGFTLGISEIEHLGLTTHIKYKPGAGFNFAYLLKDYHKHGRGRGGKWKYGPEAVIFRASGIEVYHHGDEEPQVIFWGATAHDIVQLRGDGDEWEVVNKNGDAIYIGLIEGCVHWVPAHWDQYRCNLVKEPGKTLRK